MRRSNSGKPFVHAGIVCMLIVFVVTGCDLFFKPVPNSLVEMITIPGGSFQMGTLSGGNSNERPVHTVTLSGFMMGKYEVTQAQYQTVMGYNPSYFSGATNPVQQMTWYDAVEFCNLLSEREGLQQVYTITNRAPVTGYPITGATVTMDMARNGYRLPTEAEWEYVARGGNGSPGNHEYAGSNNVNTIGWYTENSGDTPHPVGTKAPNGLGLYDMSGNVWEWCWDWYGVYEAAVQTNPTGPSSGTYRVVRGGGWGSSASFLRVASRYKYGPTDRSTNIGFRLVRPQF